MVKPTIHFALSVLHELHWIFSIATSPITSVTNCQITKCPFNSQGCTSAMASPQPSCTSLYLQQDAANRSLYSISIPTCHRSSPVQERSRIVPITKCTELPQQLLFPSAWVGFRLGINQHSARVSTASITYRTTEVVSTQHQLLILVSRKQDGQVSLQRAIRIPTHICFLYSSVLWENGIDISCCRQTQNFPRMIKHDKHHPMRQNFLLTSAKNLSIKECSFYSIE